jgi:hypothetical protein
MAGINPGTVFPTAGGNLVLNATSGSAIFTATKSGPGGPPIRLPKFPGSPDPHNPQPLPVGHIIGSVSDTLPEPFQGDWYVFNWPSLQPFDAIVSVTDAPADAVFTAQISCQSVGLVCAEPGFWDFTLDAADDFAVNISFLDFFAGIWEIGIFGGFMDPDLTIQFLTPVEGVAAEEVTEPGSIALLGVGLGSFAALRRRKRSL